MTSEGLRPDLMQSSVPAIKPAVSGAARPQIPATQGFGSYLQQQVIKPTAMPLTFSGHALMRMQQRQINLSAAESQALSEAAAKAREKGAKETLILSDRAAFVVSVQNSTVITVMDKDNLRDNVFTQIDSAIVI